MKRSLVLVGIILAVLVAACFLYRFSPLCKRTTTLRISIESVEETGYRASLTNAGVLPVLVGRCETVSDAMQPDIQVGDVIQLWQTRDNTWTTIFKRDKCQLVPLGIIEANFTRKLLWPGKQLNTAPFFPNTNSPYTKWHSGDTFRFVVYTDSPSEDANSIKSLKIIIQ
jgi:hypothetical protein